MKILLDTNFILTCVKQKIDFVSLADERFDEKIDWIVPQQVLNELENLKDRKGMKTRDREAAELSFSILENMNPEIIDIGKHPNVDIAIVNYCFGKDIVIATLDNGLKKRLNNKILTIREKKNLEIS